ncbi:DMT family transporter, partial [Methylobacterium sp. WL93]|uniref:DMT family transporter n=1 Tax=Methylobacterium sp. WL93 TaxID=2603892 RepID=UPI0011CA0B8C
MPALLANVLIPSLFVLIWATGFIAARFVAPHAQPLPFVALRVIGVALVLGAIALALRARWPRTRAGWRDAMVAGVLMQGCYIVGVFWAIHRGLPAGIAALVGSLQPLATAMLAGPVLGEAVSLRRWCGIGLGPLIWRNVVLVAPGLEPLGLTVAIARIGISALLLAAV